MGNLTEKQAQFALVRKIQKNIKQRVSLIHKQRGESEKTSPKWANLHKNTPKFCFEVNWRAKVPWNLKKKGIRKIENCKKTSPKNKQILIKTCPKTSKPQVFKKAANPQKKQAQIRGKTARLATLLQRSLFADFDAILGAIFTSHIHRNVMSQP